MGGTIGPTGFAMLNTQHWAANAHLCEHFYTLKKTCAMYIYVLWVEWLGNRKGRNGGLSARKEWGKIATEIVQS